MTITRSQLPKKYYCKFQVGSFRVFIISSGTAKKQTALMLFNVKNPQKPCLLSITDYHIFEVDRFWKVSTTEKGFLIFVRLDSHYYRYNLFYGSIIDNKIHMHQFAPIDLATLQSYRLFPSHELVFLSRKKGLPYYLNLNDPESKPCVLPAEKSPIDDVSEKSTFNLTKEGSFLWVDNHRYQLPELNTHNLLIISLIQQGTSFLLPLINIIVEYMALNNYGRFKEHSLPVFKIRQPISREIETALQQKLAVSSKASLAQQALSSLLLSLREDTYKTIQQCIEEMEEKFPQFRSEGHSRYDFKLFGQRNKPSHYQVIRNIVDELNINDPDSIPAVVSHRRPL